MAALPVAMAGSIGGEDNGSGFFTDERSLGLGSANSSERRRRLGAGGFLFFSSFFLFIPHPSFFFSAPVVSFY
jgi:hypothetical protein